MSHACLVVVTSVGLLLAFSSAGCGGGSSYGAPRNYSPFTPEELEERERWANQQNSRQHLYHLQQQLPPRRQVFGMAQSGDGSRFWHENDTLGAPYKTHTASEQSLANEVVLLINQERANAGLPALAFDSQAQVAAKLHAEDMAGRRYFTHEMLGGQSVEERLLLTGASGNFGRCGQSLARDHSTPRDVMPNWNHHQSFGVETLNNALVPHYTHLGVGYDEDSEFWVAVFLER